MTAVVGTVAIAAWFLVLHNLAGPLAARWATKRLKLRRETRISAATVAAVLIVAGVVLAARPADATAHYHRPFCLTTIHTADAINPCHM